MSTRLGEIQDNPTTGRRFGARKRIAAGFRVKTGIRVPSFSTGTAFSVRFSKHRSFCFGTLITHIIRLRSPNHVNDRLVDLSRTNQ